MEAQHVTNIDGLLDNIGGLTLNEVVALTRALRERFDLPDVVEKPLTVVSGPAEVTEWSVYASGMVGAKVAAIKAVREILGLGLKESKDFVDSLPHEAGHGLAREDADALAKRFIDGGLSVEVR